MTVHVVLRYVDGADESRIRRIVLRGFEIARQTRDYRVVIHVLTRGVQYLKVLTPVISDVYDVSIMLFEHDDVRSAVELIIRELGEVSRIVVDKDLSSALPDALLSKCELV